ncbi:hypothetical protein M378DRAFT_173659 [Amanita muscaria Koide BX008]|uniref:Protein kinase domain-containing protein n=1 Tax=Amanita muscaria (strain Koide BX008) TaxID=946122 RepID=A0A0C2W2U2_AMAMK|nr:hypothetical protein M378DRAFT_173659 [Amanita muscaria Koide BX008]
MIKDYPLKIELPINEWQEVMEPLLDLQDNLLQMSNFASTTDLLDCDECTVFHLLRELLHLGLHLGMFQGEDDDASIQSVMNVRKRRGVVSSTTNKRKKKILKRKDADGILLSLFAQLPEIMENSSPNEQLIKLLNDILHFESSEIARRVRFVSDAQKLVDLLVYLIDEKNALNRIQPDATRKATLLALDVFARAPILPSSPFLHGDNKLHPHPWTDGIPIQILSQTIFAGRILDRRYIVPVLVVERGFKGKDGVWLVSGDAGGNDLPMEEWRQSSIPSSMRAQVMLGLAKAIQYFHSMGIVLHGEFGSNDVFLDSALHPKIRCLCSFSRIPLEQSSKAWFSPTDNIFSFGCLFYELFSVVDTKPSSSTKQRRHLIADRPYKYVWQLIQECCAEDLGNRPTMDEIVQEIESWTID